MYSLISAYMYFFSFQVVAATNRVDILDPALLRSGLSSIIISLFFRFFFYVCSMFSLPEKYPGKCKIGIVPLDKNFNVGSPLHDRLGHIVRHKLGWDANNAVMEFLGPNLSREKKN